VGIRFAAAVVLLAGSAPVGLSARLAPVGGVSANGTFSGSAVVAHRAATMQWKVRASGLSGKPTQISIRLGKVSLPLCVSCGAKLSGATLLQPSIWHQVELGRGTLVVATKARPGGELRGAIRRR
jgi:hypothetical protein